MIPNLALKLNRITFDTPLYKKTSKNGKIHDLAYFRQFLGQKEGQMLSDLNFESRFGILSYNPRCTNRTTLTLTLTNNTERLGEANNNNYWYLRTPRRNSQFAPISLAYSCTNICANAARLIATQSPITLWWGESRHQAAMGLKPAPPNRGPQSCGESAQTSSHPTPDPMRPLNGERTAGKPAINLEALR